MGKVKMPALPLPDAAMFAPRVKEYGLACAEEMREACASRCDQVAGIFKTPPGARDAKAAKAAAQTCADAIRALEIET